MSAFNRVTVHTTKEAELSADVNCNALVVAEAGCTTGEIIENAMAAGVIVPLGSRPSVGAGLWLQGRIGHLARMHGLACDTIVGAVVVSVDSSQVLCVGHVPSQHQPAGSVRSENEANIIWALKGAGTNFSIVVKAIFKAYTAPKYLVQNWAVPLNDGIEAQQRLSNFQTEVSSNLKRNCSADVYLYEEEGQPHLGVTIITSTTTMPFSAHCPFFETMCSVLGAEEDSTDFVDSFGMFEKDMYIPNIHGGHGGGKTSSFKRCVFLKDIGNEKVVERLVAAVECQPSLCYLHLLQGGGAIGDIAADASAFGCRDWDFACVITGVWPRN